MDTHMEESSQQHLTLMCSMVSKQQQQIVSMKKVINNLAVNQSGKLYFFKSIQNIKILIVNIKKKKCIICRYIDLENQRCTG